MKGILVSPRSSFCFSVPILWRFTLAVGELGSCNGFLKVQRILKVIRLLDRWHWQSNIMMKVMFFLLEGRIFCESWHVNFKTITEATSASKTLKGCEVEGVGLFIVLKSLQLLATCWKNQHSALKWFYLICSTFDIYLYYCLCNLKENRKKISKIGLAKGTIPKNWK